MKIGYLIEDSILFNGRYRVVGFLKTANNKRGCRIIAGIKTVENGQTFWHGLDWYKLSFAKKYQDVDIEELEEFKELRIYKEK